MYTIDLKFHTFTGAEATETLRFNLTEDELRDLVRRNPMFDLNFLSYVSKEQDLNKMLDVVQELIVVSYGEMSDDGKYFRKSDDRALDFLQSAAYEEFKRYLFKSEDGHEFLEFLTKVFPKNVADQMKKRAAEGMAAGKIPVLNMPS